ncbi:MAG: hypothetical protein ACHQSE_10120 [Gemmatimonadales bacterium]
MSNPVFLQTVAIIAGVVTLMVVAQVFLRVLELKNERRGPVALEGLAARLDRIEAAVESTAIEVERISEANRFMSKVLADHGRVDETT